MITAAQIAKSIYGACRLARFDAGGLQFFDNTLEEFWRSFFAAVIVAPMVMVLVATDLAELTLSAGPVRIFLVETVAYIVDWVLFPLVVLYVADFLGKGDRYFRYIAARNWAIVLQMSLIVVISLLSQAGILGESSAGPLRIMVFVVILIFQGYITRIGLETTTQAAVAIVLMDLVIGLILSAITIQMIL